MSEYFQESGQNGSIGPVGDTRGKTEYGDFTDFNADLRLRKQLAIGVELGCCLAASNRPGKDLLVIA